jgi:hypothetical protein
MVIQDVVREARMKTVLLGLLNVVVAVVAVCAGVVIMFAALLDGCKGADTAVAIPVALSAGVLAVLLAHPIHEHLMAV